jgi:NAD(P)-dependent dehydrogenase (short-subunit alcohol dehydrogenase family)
LNLASQCVVVVGGTSGMARRRSGRHETWALMSCLQADFLCPSAGPPTVREVVADTDEESVRALFASVGELDHLLITASPGQSGRLLDQDLAQARSFMDGKFFGSWMCARYAALACDLAGRSLSFERDRTQRHSTARR